MTKIKAFLKWAGGKYNCIETILSALPLGSRLVEPFVGSGVVFMNANYNSYLMGESNHDLINLYKTLKQEGGSFIDYCQQYFQPQFNNKEKYYGLRSEFNSINNTKQKSALFLYLNRHGFNGLCRYNSKGIYNVPFGLYLKPYFPREEMMVFHQKSQSVEFINQDFRKTFELAKTGDVIYCDPPYVLLSEHSIALPYTKKKFEEADQIELAELAKQTASKGIPVIISNHDTEFTRYHYREAQIKSFAVARWINCQAERRRPVKELVAIFK